MPVVAVTHPDGRRTTYQPVLAAVVRGEVVSRGAILGRVSAVGSHCLPLACLHWGLRRGSTYLDPLSLVGADTGCGCCRLARPGPRLGPLDALPPVEPDRPGVDRAFLQMRPVPGIAREGGADLVRRVGLDGEHHALLVAERPTQDDEARVRRARP